MNKDKPEYTPTSIRLPRRMAAKLEELKALNKTSKSAMIVRLIANALGMPEYQDWMDEDKS